MKSLGGDTEDTFMADDREGMICAYIFLIFKKKKTTPLDVSIFLAEGNYITSLEKKQGQVPDVTSFFSLHSTLDNLREEYTLKENFFSLRI